VSIQITLDFNSRVQKILHLFVPSLKTKDRSHYCRTYDQICRRSSWCSMDDSN